MLRFQPLVTVALGLGVVVPLGAQADSSLFAQLRAELTRTTSALTELERLEAQSLAGAPVGIERLRALSEAPTTPPELADLRLEALQLEVRELGVQLDGLRARRGLPGSELPGSSERRLDALGAAPSSTVGLEPSRLSELARSVALNADPSLNPALPVTGAPTGDAPASLPTAPTAIERIDPLAGWRLGAAPIQVDNLPVALATARALYRSGDYQTALQRFAALPESAESQFWSARCLERIGDASAALELYAQVESSGEAGDWPTRAKEAAEFLRWKLGLDAAHAVEAAR